VKAESSTLRLTSDSPQARARKTRVRTEGFSNMRHTGNIGMSNSRGTSARWKRRGPRCLLPWMVIVHAGTCGCWLRSRSGPHRGTMRWGASKERRLQTVGEWMDRLARLGEQGHK